MSPVARHRHYLSLQSSPLLRVNLPCRLLVGWSPIDPGCVKTSQASKPREWLSRRSKSNALRNCHCPHCDPRKDLFYQFSHHAFLRSQDLIGTSALLLKRAYRAARDPRLSARPMRNSRSACRQIITNVNVSIGSPMMATTLCAAWSHCARSPSSVMLIDRPWMLVALSWFL